MRETFGGCLAEERILDDAASLDAFADDLTEEEPARPGIVLFPEVTAEVQALVRAAAKDRIPLTVRVTGSNVAGLTVPPARGAVVDLSRMNRLELDPREMIAVVEPGVTWAALKPELERLEPPLRIGYPLSPPHTSVLANCLLDGLGNLSLRHGSLGDWLTGVEVVLPDGSLVRTGSAAASASWCSRGPLPDLTGLFVAWQGATGIVVRGGVHVWPRPAFRRRLFVLAGERRGAFETMRRLARSTIADDAGGLSWPTGKMLFGVPRPGPRDPAEPEFFVYIDVTGESERELALRLERLDALLAALRAEGHRLEPPFSIADLVRLEPRFARFADFPTSLDFLLHAPGADASGAPLGGGLTWVGTYGPGSRLEEAADRVVPLMEQAGFAPAIVSRPMRGGHFVVLRMLMTFEKGDAAQRRLARETNRKVLGAVMPLGFLPYKCPPWAWDMLQEQLDPGYAALLAKVRAAIDPAGIMSPRAWRRMGRGGS
ncbi:MAG: FAD-binding oxidoreductase [Deltaproteobacteria bacterium]|nr:FAD-binding oxidoreductase [Deltaproteobacteria bacterium]